MNVDNSVLQANSGLSEQIQARQQNGEYDVSPAGQRVNDRLKLSMDEQCSLEDEMEKIINML